MPFTGVHGLGDRKCSVALVSFTPRATADHLIIMTSSETCHMPAVFNWVEHLQHDREPAKHVSIQSWALGSVAIT